MKLTSVLFFLFLFSISKAQTLEELKAETKKVYDASYNIDFDEILNYSYPKLIELVDRTQMTQVLESNFQNPEFSVRFVYPNPAFSYSELKKINNQTFCVVRYNGAIRMKYGKPLTEQLANGMLTTFKQHMAGKKVTFEKERNSFLIEGESVMIAIADNVTQNKWRFLNYDAGQLDFIDKMLTETVRKQLGL